jgi:hypothetical protein
MLCKVVPQQKREKISGLGKSNISLSKMHETHEKDLDYSMAVAAS